MIPSSRRRNVDRTYINAKPTNTASKAPFLPELQDKPASRLKPEPNPSPFMPNLSKSKSESRPSSKSKSESRSSSKSESRSKSKSESRSSSRSKSKSKSHRHHSPSSSSSESYYSSSYTYSSWSSSSEWWSPSPPARTSLRTPSPVVYKQTSRKASNDTYNIVKWIIILSIILFIIALFI